MKTILSRAGWYR